MKSMDRNWIDAHQLNWSQRLAHHASRSFSVLRSSGIWRSQPCEHWFRRREGLS
jgi:hypothetical protein